MLPLSGSLITSFALAAFIFPILIRYSYRKNILDLPGYRRIHTRITPSIGGVAIFFGFITGSIIWLEPYRWMELKSLFGILFLMFVLGLCDDLVHVKPIVKIVGQVIAGSLAYFLLTIRIESTYDLLPLIHFPFLFSYSITIFTIIIITNSFNLIDGIDGLSGTFSLVCFIFLGCWFFLTNDLSYAIICFSIAGGIIAFLIFNWEPSRIFMGDTGALLIGMMLAILTIRFMNVNDGLDENSPFKFSATIATALALLIIPLTDTTRIIIVRLYRGISPLKADKRHIHHCLVRLGLRHYQAVLILSGIHVFFIAIILLCRNLSDIYLIPVVFLLSLTLCLVLDRLMLRKIS